MTRRVLQGISAAVIVVAGISFIAGYREPSLEVIDHHNYQVAIDGVRAGQGYYAAYDIGFREAYGPIPSVRDVRPPTLYVALAALPEGSEHVAYAVVAVISGLVAVALARFPVSGIAVTFYLLSLAISPGDAAQFLYAELWVIPLALGSILALDRGHDGWALGLATAAFAVREQGILLLGGVALYLWLHRRSRWLSGAALVIAAGGYFLHTLAVQPYLDAVNGVHTPLHLGWHPLTSLLRTTAFGLYDQWLGVLFFIGAWVWAYRHRLLLALGPFLAMPLLALWVNRPYWGAMVVPITVVLTLDMIWEVVMQSRVPSPPRVATASPSGSRDVATFSSRGRWSRPR